MLTYFFHVCHQNRAIFGPCKDPFSLNVEIRAHDAPCVPNDVSEAEIRARDAPCVTGQHACTGIRAHDAPGVTYALWLRSVHMMHYM